jgi:hypothetical protein
MPGCVPYRPDMQLRSIAFRALLVNLHWVVASALILVKRRP